jgi:hypothetical protein
VDASPDFLDFLAIESKLCHIAVVRSYNGLWLRRSYCCLVSQVVILTPFPKSCIELPMRPPHAVSRLPNGSLVGRFLSRIPSRKTLIVHWLYIFETPESIAPLAR